MVLGRLQTERDRQRVLDGLEGVASESDVGFERGEIADILSGLGKRVFLLHNVHEDHPVTFQTRWVLSYLAGPMTRTQVKTLMASKKALMKYDDESEPKGTGRENSETRTSPVKEATTRRDISQRPVLPPSITQVFLPIRCRVQEDQLVYCPGLLATGGVHFVNTRKGLSAEEEPCQLAMFEGPTATVHWDASESIQSDSGRIESDPALPGEFTEIPAEASQSKSYTKWRKRLADHLYRSARFPLWRSPALDEYSFHGESEREFRIRLVERAREARDAHIETLRKKYAPKLRAMEERVRKAEARAGRERREASDARVQSAISLGATILSAVLGRKRISSTTVGKAATAARGWNRASQQADDVQEAEKSVQSHAEKLEDLELELEQEVQELTGRFDALSETFDEVELKPRRTDIDIQQLALAWVPMAKDSLGNLKPIYK